MNRRFMILAFLCTAWLTSEGRSPHLVICTLENYPELPSQPSAPHSAKTGSAKAQSGSSEGSSTHNNTTLTTKKPEGVYATYFGYLDRSNSSGELIFPRKHNDSSFMIAVSKNINPVFMIKKTLSNLEIAENKPYAYYSCKQEKNAQTNLYFWNIQKETLPPDRKLPLNTIIFFASPEELYIPTGITVITKSPHLCLPPIYVKKDIKTAENALAVLPLRHLFETVQKTFKTEKADVISKLTPLQK